MTWSSKGNSKRRGGECSKHTNSCSLVSFFKEVLEKKRVAGTQPSRDRSHKLCPGHCSVGWETTSIMFCWALVPRTGQKESHQDPEAKRPFSLATTRKPQKPPARLTPALTEHWVHRTRGFIQTPAQLSG